MYVSVYLCPILNSANSQFSTYTSWCKMCPVRLSGDELLCTHFLSRLYLAVSLILSVLAFIVQFVILSIFVPIVNLPVFQGTSIPPTAVIIHHIY